MKVARSWKPADAVDPTGDGFFFVSRWQGRVLVWELGAPSVVMTPDEARSLATAIADQADKVDEEGD